MQRFYLDDNATTNLDPRVRAVMEPLLAAPLGALGNPSSLHAEGRRARGEIDAARDAIAAWLKGKPSEIIFTGGGTARIGNRVRLYQGVGLVARSLAKHVQRDEQGHALGGKRHPTVGDDVTIYANSTIVGGDTVIGDRTIIGGNVWLNRSIPPDSIAFFEAQQVSIRPKQYNGGDWII